jgi:hypothetical protein
MEIAREKPSSSNYAGSEVMNEHSLLVSGFCRFSFVEKNVKT